MTGAGVDFHVDKGNNLVQHLGFHPSLFQSEIFSITLAADRMISIISGEPDAERIIIPSDSQAAIDSLTSLRTRSHMVNQCVDSSNQSLPPVGRDPCWHYW